MAFSKPLSKAVGTLARSRSFLAAFLAVVALAAVRPSVYAQSLYDQHVVFDNSLPDKAYYFSEGWRIAPSTLALSEGKFPVQTDRFVSPPNALRLTWRSVVGGDWRMLLKIQSRYARTFAFTGDTLSFWCYSDSEINELNSPRIALQDSSGIGSPSITLVTGTGVIPAGKWVEVRLPFTSFLAMSNGTDDRRFSPRDLVSLSFTQGLDDDRERTLYLDDVQIRDLRSDDTTAPDAPTALKAKGQDRHVDLQWEASQAKDVLAYRIYRRADDGEFTQIGLQQETRTRYVDFLGKSGLEAEYRVTAVDVSGNESVATSSVKAKTRSYSDDELLEMVQEACFRYYWDNGHPLAGLAPEILPGDKNLLATGGSGFGIMALIVGAERRFVPREAVAERLVRIVRFLSKADRFRGAWSHFVNGDTGKVIPYFGKYDNGGDLVETAFLVQGLLAARQYFDRDAKVEQEIRETITELWEGIDWSWYRKSADSDLLYWHWSREHGFHISHPLIGWNEAFIVYLLAIASPTHPIPPKLYHSGWAGQSEQHVRYRRGWSRSVEGSLYTNGKSYYGIKLEVGEGNGAELFFTHFSFMGFDPRHKRDAYTNYFDNNTAIARINHAYCVENPRGHKGYGEACWGLSAGINSGGGRPLPRDDNGTINVMASLASMPYTPKESMAALKHFYRDLGPKVWGIYGFHDGFNQSTNWFEEVYMALNQAPITVMIENHRTGLIWKSFMANPEIAPALEAMGFKPDRPAP